jgi:hypothetical protein
MKITISGKASLCIVGEISLGKSLGKFRSGNLKNFEFFFVPDQKFENFVRTVIFCTDRNFLYGP